MGYLRKRRALNYCTKTEVLADWIVTLQKASSGRPLYNMQNVEPTMEP